MIFLGHLEQQKRKVPLILETSIDELQKRGMRLKVSKSLCILPVLVFKAGMMSVK